VAVVKGFAFKYSERLKNWGEQIDTGVTKNWLTADEAQTFKTRLEQLRQLNQAVSDKGYARADLDDMEKQFSQYNIDLSHALDKPKPSAAAVPGLASKFEPEPAPNRFDSEISKFEQEDKRNHERVDTLFIGSSTFAMWSDLESRFKQFHPLNRGFGGSTLPEADHYLHRILNGYAPSRVVIYEGTNDVPLGHSARRIYEDFVKLEHDLRSERPKAEVFFISMSVPPSRLQWEAVYVETNLLIREFAEHTPHVHYIDVTPAMRDAHGGLRSDLFSSEDHLHMTARGYDEWTPIILHALESVPVPSDGPKH
jgi:lysophospholipase L1-like esterase